MNEDAIILKEYREAFRKYAKNGIIDMDRRLPYKFNLQIHRLEDAILEWEGVVPPMRQSQPFIILVRKGTGEKTVGQFTFAIRGPMLIIVPKRIVTSTKYDSTEVCGYILSFNSDFFLQSAFPTELIKNKKIFKKYIKPNFSLSAHQDEKLNSIFESVWSEYKGALESKQEMIAIKVLEILILCDRFFTRAETDQQDCIYNEVVESFNELIEKNFTRHRSVQFYADKLHIHPNHLNFLVRKYTGLTAKETIINHILLEAKVLLHSSSLTIKEIAYELGFEDPSYFSSFFRKNLKVSPAQYKLNPV